MSDALSSVVAYERWLRAATPPMLATIAAYNELDCLSTRDARDWLEQRRAELARTTDVPVSRPQLTDGTPPTRRSKRSLGWRGSPPTSSPPARRPGGTAPIRRRRRGCSPTCSTGTGVSRGPNGGTTTAGSTSPTTKLVDDPAAIGLIGAGEYVADVKRSAIWQYAFPPQDTKLPSGPLRYVDPATQQPPASLVESVDPETGLLRLRRGNNQPAPAMRALIPGPPLPQRNQQEALYQLGEQVREHGIDGPGPRRAARDLLLRRPPRLADPRPGPLLQPGEEPAAAVVRLGARLDRGVLAVQGPPGTGKTYAGARLVVSLLAAGQRVGICAYSHKVIGNLLDEVARVAAEVGLSLRGLQKCQDSERCESRCLPTHDRAEEGRRRPRDR